MRLSRFAGWTYAEVMNLDLDEAAYWLETATAIAHQEAEDTKAAT